MIIEIEEKTALGGNADQHLNLMWCPACGRRAEKVTPEQADRMAGVSARTASPAESQTREPICSCGSRR